MCGINGFNFEDKDLIQAMNLATKHRGPDGVGFYTDANVSFGHNRLAIIDLSEKGKQPMSRANGRFWITFNGEIYNYLELRDQLIKKGHSFNSETDTEVILCAYEEYGTKCLDLLNGMFAFAIWDKERKELFLARDRIGIKPLFYYFQDGKFIFSSEIKGILQLKPRLSLDILALNMYLGMMYIPAPLTIYQEIHKLEAGHYLILKNNQLIEKKYWEVRDFTDYSDQKLVTEELRNLFADAVKRQLIADREVGVFLSGGVDSTALLAQVRQFRPDKLKTFSVGFDVDEEMEKYNRDFERARDTAKRFQTCHYELFTGSNDVLKYLDTMIYHLDEPLANSNHVSTYLLSKMAKKEVAVVLGGDGGDELFGGYDKYAVSLLISKFQKLPAFLRKTLSKIIGGMLPGKRGKNLGMLLSSPPNEERYIKLAMEKDNEVLLQDGYLDLKAVLQFFQKKYFGSWRGGDFEKKIMLTDIQTWLAEESLARSDRLTMAAGLEGRVPYLDHRLVELVMKIPTAWKIKGKSRKWIFRRTFHDFLPHEVKNSLKTGWNAPVSKWLRLGLKELAFDTLSDNRIKKSGFFRHEAVKKILDEHMGRKVYHAQTLWLLIVFQLWYEKNSCYFK